MAGAQVIKDLLEDTPEARNAMVQVFKAMDPNGNRVLSVAEAHKYMQETWPEFDAQRMLIRAHSAADTDGTGFITFIEFRKFLKYVLFFDDLYDKFQELDTDADHRLSEAEFVKGCELVGGDKIEDPAAAFHAMDQNAGGVVLFDEFSVWIARKLCVDGEGVDEEMYNDAYNGSLGAIAAADGQAVKSGAWWKGRAKLQAMTTKGDPKAAEDRMTLFKRIDADGSRGVTPSEVFKAVQKMWPEFDSMAAVRSAFKAADRTGDGRIQKKEIRILLKYLLFYDEGKGAEPRVLCCVASASRPASVLCPHVVHLTSFPHVVKSCSIDICIYMYIPLRKTGCPHSFISFGGCLWGLDDGGRTQVPFG
eukprot:m.195400 g.195400  ORF g.195400 m.195400 type:complete len:363 (+) comp25034_c1_seq12:4192-5280(+)